MGVVGEKNVPTLVHGDYPAGAPFDPIWALDAGHIDSVPRKLFDDTVQHVDEALVVDRDGRQDRGRTGLVDEKTAEAA